MRLQICVIKTNWGLKFLRPTCWDLSLATERTQKSRHKKVSVSLCLCVYVNHELSYGADCRIKVKHLDGKKRRGIKKGRKVFCYHPKELQAKTQNKLAYLKYGSEHVVYT